MSNGSADLHEHYPDPHHDLYSRTTFGFWIYLLTDFVFFGTLLATYAVLNKSTFGGASSRELFHISSALIPTLVLLFSSFTIGLGAAYAHRKEKNNTIILFSITFALGIIFLWLELADFARLIHSGNGWPRSAFLSAFFTLVGTHAVHMIFALIWAIIFMVPIFKEGVSPISTRRLTCLKMFWQFLNVIWVFIFSFVYLMGGK